VGLGVGGGHVKEAGLGFAMSPRVGGNFLVGRSGILTPSLSYLYTTHNFETSTDGTTVVALTSALQANIGFTVMW
jgi:hypothetical protein